MRRAIRACTCVGLGLLIALAALACRGDREKARPGDATVSYHPQTAPGAPPGYSKPYAFSDDFFSSNIPVWRQVFAPLAGKPGLHYLEIGAYEGRSFLWMLENVLTDPTSRLTAVDIFEPPQVETRFLDNLKLSGQAQRVTTIKGASRVELRKLPLESCDIIYVDGSHTADDVLADAVLAFGLLKDGGLVVFDDYLGDGSNYAGPGNRLPAELLPGPAVYAFINTHRNYLDVVYAGYQVVLRKHANPCPNKSACSPLGDYTYEWANKSLFRGPGRSPLVLTAAEARALEAILQNRVFLGRFVLPERVLQQPGVRELIDRLGLRSELPILKERPTS